MNDNDIEDKDFKTQVFGGYDKRDVRHYLKQISRYVQQLELDKRLLEGKNRGTQCGVGGPTKRSRFV